MSHSLSDSDTHHPTLVEQTVFEYIWKHTQNCLVMEMSHSFSKCFLNFGTILNIGVDVGVFCEMKRKDENVLTQES